MSSRNRFTINIFILAFLINIGIGSTYLIDDAIIMPEPINEIQILPKISTSHSQIAIIGDLELDAFCEGNGTSGSSWETAHVIENYEIGTVTGNGISLTDTTRFLIIQDCIINQSSSVGIRLQNCTNIKFQNCNIDLSGKIGMSVGECTDIDIQNCIFQSTFGQGINITESERILISESDILNNQDEGLGIEDTNSSKIIKSIISQNGKDGVYAPINCHNILFLENSIFENEGGIFMYRYSSNISFIDNEICNNSGIGISSELNCNDAFIGNIISNNEDNGIQIYESNSSTFENNEICNNNGKGIEAYLNNWDNFYGNTILTNGDNGLVLDQSNYSIVERNIVLNNSGYGLLMYGDDSGNYNIISNNTFSNNSECGIILHGKCQHNIIKHNEICNNLMSGVYLTDFQHNNTISFNNISNNSQNGILLDDYSQNSTISDNNIKDNGDKGILIDLYCNNNIIKYNLCSGSSSGILLTNNENNSIYGNNFSFNDGYGIESLGYKKASIFGNIVSFNQYGINLDIKTYYNTFWVNFISNNSDYQGSNSDISNFLDNGIVGNYWGDYKELHPSANFIGNIWDTNYTLDGFINSNDTKPLVNIDPVISLLPSSNITYLVGETGHFISWMITDTYYWNSEYFIYLDDVLVKTGNWVSGDAFSVNVDGLEYGTYLYRIVARDGTAWGKNENTIKVIVGIIPEPPIFTTLSQTINVTNITIRWAAINFTEYYFIYMNDTLIGNTTSTEFLIEFNDTGEFIIGLTALNAFGESNRSLSISIIVEKLIPDKSKTNFFWYIFGGGWILVAGFIGFAVVKVKLKR